MAGHIKEDFMKRLTKLLGIIAMAAVIATGMAGCSSDDDDDGLGNLPAINEQTTGRESITGTDIPLEAGRHTTQAAVNSLNLAGETNYNGAAWSVKDGKLTFSLGTPTYTSTFDAEDDYLEDWTDVQVSPADAQAYMFERFYSMDDDYYYDVGRRKVETDEQTYYRSSEIIYLYVSKDVTVSGKSGKDDAFTYTALNLSLKAGWNLLQENSSQTKTSGTQSVSIATKNVPWAVTLWDD
jgi:hypothetical protein